MLAAHIWKEESIRVETEEEERERRTKRTGSKTTEGEEENKTESEETEAARKTWETRQATKNRGNKTLEEMGFNEKAESSSSGGRIRRRERCQQDNETYEHPKEKDSKKPKTRHIKDKTETKREKREQNKHRRKELREKLEGQIREWSQGEPEGDEITEMQEKFGIK